MDRTVHYLLQRLPCETRCKLEVAHLEQKTFVGDHMSMRHSSIRPSLGLDWTVILYMCVHPSVSQTGPERTLP